MIEASPEGQNLNESVDNEKNVLQQELMVWQPSLIHPDNVDLWSNARIESEKIDMRIIFRAMSSSLPSCAQAKTSNKRSGPVLDKEIEEDFKMDLEDKPGSSKAFFLTEETAEVPRNS